MLQCVAGRNARKSIGVLQCVAVCCSVLQGRVDLIFSSLWVCSSVLQCVAVCCSVLQCVAVCCSVLQGLAERHALKSIGT